MGYFPFFIDIGNKKCVIIGGGRVAFRKAEKIAAFGAQITVIAPEICDEFRKIGVKRIERCFEESDIEGAFMVVAATDDEDMNKHISQVCMEKGILINSAGGVNECGFIFPAISKKDNVTAAVCTEGKAPAYAKKLRKYIDDIINDDEAALIADYRKKIKSEMTDTKKRKAAMRKFVEINANK